MAVRAVVAAAAATPVGPRLDPLDEAELLLQQLIGAETAGPRSERIRSAARVLAAYGRHYPHKILVPAPPPVPAPATPSCVSFVVPARDAAGQLPGLLASIARQEVPRGYAVEVVVVDDGSTDRTGEVARAEGAVVERGPGRGAGDACGAGARRARGEALVFVDPGVRLVGCDFLHHVLRALAFAPEVGLVGAAIECAPGVGPIGRAAHMVSFFDWQPTRFAGRRVFQPGVALVVRRPAYDAIGGFAAGLPHSYDLDFCRRARALGWALAFEPAARVERVPQPGLRAALGHAFAEGWDVRRVHAASDTRLRWWFLDRPALFALNVPVQVARRAGKIARRWLWRRPVDTVLLAPLLLALLAAWGAGVAVGGWRTIRTLRAASDLPRPGTRAAA
jgi:glycosyltransferase involved in cell wall biosynthesis